MKNKDVVKELLKVVHGKIKSDSAGSLPDLCDLHHAEREANEWIKDLKEYYGYKELLRKIK